MLRWNLKNKQVFVNNCLKDLEEMEILVEKTVSLTVLLEGSRPVSLLLLVNFKRW